MNNLEHVVYKLRNATVNKYPFSHFFVEKVFPDGFYYDLLDCLPRKEKYHQLSKAYESRQITDGGDHHPLLGAFETPEFAQHVISIFQREFYVRYPYNNQPRFRSEWRFVRDSEGYAIGPHTDAPNKVVSLLFYLPRYDADRSIGTGIYVPTDHQKTCKGGPHYPFEGFEEVWRAPFIPNSCFGFWKTSNSWHAVEKISYKIERNVLLFNIYEEAP